ncbi:MAG: hypothetical protein JOZ57_14785, partial [Abitibacteriaceae bacterium]|nr:hypothetical protein [Abditibacteriaceae bacterium]
MEPSIASRITSALGNRPVRWTSASESGCTANQRWVVCLSSGQTAFVKAAVDERTAGWLRREYFMYSHLTGSLMPQLLGWCDNGEWPLLIIEDLSQAHWPPPWTPASIHVVRQALNELAAIPVSGV